MFIALTGGFRQGKTYFGEQIGQACGIPHMAYADELKRIAAERFSNRAAEIYAEEKTADARALLFRVGKEFNRDYWANFVHDRFDLEGHGVVSDMRFFREYEDFINRYPEGKIISIGPIVDQYDCAAIQEMADIKLPAKPFQTLEQVKECIQSL